MIKFCSVRRSLLLLLLLIPAFIVGSQSAMSRPIPKPSMRFSPPPPPAPSNPTEPDDRPQGGGSRGCDGIALVPTVAAGDKSLSWGLTTLDRPAVWVRVRKGKPLTNRDRFTFALQDGTGKSIYTTQLTAPNSEPGIVRLAFPNQVAPLQVGKSYRWSFSIECDAADLEDRPSIVSGRIQRVAIAPALKQQLASAKTPQAQAEAYARNGIWYDALGQLGTRLQTRPDPSLASAWTTLLQQANLDAPASLIRPCCTLQ